MRRCLAALILVAAASADRAAAQQVSGDWEYSLAFIDRFSTNRVAVISKYVGPPGPAAVPSEIDGYPVQTIGGGLASIDPSSKLTAIIIPDNATSIASYAFWMPTNLAAVTIGNGVKTIGFGAFAYSQKLTQVALPGSLGEVGSYAFYGATNLARVQFSPGLTNIGPAAFSDCPQLAEAVIPEGVLTIGDFAFNYGKGLTNVVFPSTLTNIGRTAFQHCSQLRSVILPDSLRSLGQEAFAYCSGLSNVVLPDGLTSLGRVAFAFCDGLTTATIGAGVDVVPDSLFDGCMNLASVVFTGPVASVGDYALADCPLLTTVLFHGNPPALAGPTGDIFGTNPSAAVYHLPTDHGWPETWAGRSVVPFRPVARSVAVANGAVNFTWSGTGDVPLRVQRSNSLQLGVWQTLHEGVRSRSFTDYDLPRRNAFYRAVYP